MTMQDFGDFALNGRISSENDVDSVSLVGVLLDVFLLWRDFHALVAGLVVEPRFERSGDRGSFGV